MPKDKRDANALYCDEASLTQQHFAQECDINEILKRAAKTGQLPINDKVPMYGDFVAVPKSLSEAFSLIKQANDLFMSLPWEARERFGNDPERMVAFLNDPKNREEAVKLGLVKPIPAKDDVSGAGSTSGDSGANAAPSKASGDAKGA